MVMGVAAICEMLIIIKEGDVEQPDLPDDVGYCVQENDTEIVIQEERSPTLRHEKHVVDIMEYINCPQLEWLYNIAHQLV